MLMYDSINPENIPPNPECVLVYTDGKYANETEMRKLFPNALIQTISAVGVVPAQWIDCETGCVWPPEAAVAVYQAWKNQGQPVEGFYSATGTQQALQEALAHVQIDPKSVAWFDADWNNVSHIDAGDTQTQFESLPGYDVSDVPDPTPAPTPAPPPPPPPPPTPSTVGDDMAVPAPCVFTTTFDKNQQVFWVDSNGVMWHEYWQSSNNTWVAAAQVSTGWQPDAEVVVNSNSNGVLQVWARLAAGGVGQVYWNGSQWVTQT